ncbi:MAG: DUF1800 domain-containing protein [Ignavibacteriales bacterium]|nr:DUF1800 domain-containing protein [Ignavibacteriales bacterium]
MNTNANEGLQTLRRSTAGLEPYSGVWDAGTASHLLRRTTFGPLRSDIVALQQKTASGAVDLLLAPLPEETSQPLSVDSRDIVPVGQTWVDAIAKDPLSTFNPVGLRMNSLRSWWIGLMLNQQLSLREKMVLFWHNHFSTEVNSVGDPRFTYRHAVLLRKNALGNYKELVRQISTDGNMLRYLNGNTNTKTSPNENYGRELQELFTIGKGPEISSGDYTNYTEADVKAAARVFTGWKDFTQADGTVSAVTSVFDATKHDSANKQFSADYGSAVVTGGVDGAKEIDDLLNIIFSQPETAKYICRKLYRWFVYYAIDDWTETNIIAPLAATLRGNNYNIAPVLRQLFTSAHFYDPLNRACMIKNPIDFLVGAYRQCQVAISSTDIAKQYTAWLSLWTQATAIEMSVGDPPNVAGWPAYYQAPQFHELWINSDTLPKRRKYTDALVYDPIALAKSFSDPGNPAVIVDEAAQFLFAISLTATQKEFLKNTLIPGLPDYEWGVEWNAYLADPTNQTKINAVKTKLQTLFGFMMGMPEYQLS